jgi:hypothetical protein
MKSATWFDLSQAKNQEFECRVPSEDLARFIVGCNDVYTIKEEESQEKQD